MTPHRFALTIGALAFCASPSFAQLGADECANADDLGSGSTSTLFDTAVCTDTGALATTSVEQQCFSLSNDVWFEWTATINGLATFDTCNNANFDTEIGVWEGSDCATMVGLGCNDDNSGAGCTGLTSLITIPCNAGTVYKVQLGYWSTSATVWGQGTLTITEAPNPCDNATDDALEDNDTCPAAVPGPAIGSTPGLFASQSDPDFYSYALAAGDILDFSIVEADTAVDMNLNLYDAACGLITSSTTDALSYSSPIAQTVIVEVFINPVQTGNGCSDYTANVAIGPDPCFSNPDDGFEDNDDCGQAVSIGDGLYVGLYVSKTDWDYYEVTVADQATLTIDLFFSHASGDTDIFLYDTGLCEPFANGNVGCTNSLICGFSASDNESISWTNTTGANRTYTVKVNIYPPTSTGDCNVYDMTVSGTTTGGGGPVITLACDPANNHSGGNYAKLDNSDGSGPGVLHLECTDGPVDQFGYFLVSDTINDPGTAVSNGMLCVTGTIGRYAPAAGGALNSIGQFDASGVFQSLSGNSTVGSGYDVLTTLPTPPGGAIDSGETWYFQCWYRDGQRSNFSNVICVTF